MRLPSLLWVGFVFAACAGDHVRTRGEVSVKGATEIASTESALFGRPIDIAVVENGDVWVLDNMLGRILVFSPDGDLVRTIGREGSGPREFVGPKAFIVSNDTLRVADVGNGRLITLALNSDYTQSIPLPVGSELGALALTEEGGLLLGTQGFHDGLATYYDGSGTQLGTLGQAPARVPQILDVRGMKQEIVGGEVPAFFRNLVHPLVAPDGAMWLILTGEALVQRYDTHGVRQLSAPLTAPQLERIWAHVLSRSRETLDDPRHIEGPVYVVDAAVIDQKLWLLLNMPDSEPAVMLGLAADGTPDRTLVFSAVRGAHSFAVDSTRDRVYFTIPSSASVVAVILPQGWH